MKKTTIKIICIASLVSSLAHAGDQFDFFRFDIFKSKEDQCKDKSAKLRDLDTQYKQNKSADQKSPIMILERDLEGLKANKAIVDGLKKINLEFKGALNAVQPDGNFLWTYNNAKKIELIQDQTKNAAANFARFRTMSNLLDGIQHTIDQEPLIPPFGLPNNITARSQWLYQELVDRQKRYGSMNSEIKDYFEANLSPDPHTDKSQLISRFMMAYSTSLFKTNGTVNNSTEQKAAIKYYKNTLFDAIPADAAARISSVETEQLNTSNEYNNYKACLSSEGISSKDSEVCKEKRNLWLTKVGNVKKTFTRIRDDLQISTSNLDSYADLNYRKLDDLATKLEASTPTIVNAKEDLISRIKNMQFYKEQKARISYSESLPMADQKLNLYNSSVKSLLCANQSCDQDHNLFKADLSIDPDQLKVYLSRIEEGQIGDNELAEKENLLNAEIAQISGEIEAIKNNPRNKIILMSMDLLAKDLVENCREKMQTNYASCTNADLGKFRAVTTKIEDLNGKVDSVMIALRGDPNTSTFVNINTECTKIVPIEDKPENKIIKDACNDAAKKYLAVENAKKEKDDSQKYFETHKITPNDRGQVYVLDDDGNRVLAEGASVDKVDSGIGRALAQSFYEQMYGDPLLPGWMTIGVNQMNLGNQLEYFDWYGKQEKTYMSWQQQYWSNINQQCAFASGMCVPVAQNPSTGLGFGF